MSVPVSAPPVAACDNLTYSPLFVPPPLTWFLVGFFRYCFSTELNCPEKCMRVSYMSTAICGYSSLPRNEISCSCSRRRLYLFRSALFKKHMARKLYLSFLLSASVTTSPSLNSACYVIYRKFLPPSISMFCTFGLKRFRNELFDSVTPVLS